MATYNLFGTGTPTTTTADRAGTTYSLGTEFYVTSSAWLTEARYFRPDTTTTQTVTAQLYSVNDSTGATGTAVGPTLTFTLGSTTGWKTVAYTAAVALTTGQHYRIAIRTTAFPEMTPYWGTTGAGASGRTSGPLVAPSRANAYGNAQSSYAVAGSGIAYPANPSDTGPGQCWFSDVTVTDVNPAGGTTAKRGAFLPFFGGGGY